MGADGFDGTLGTDGADEFDGTLGTDEFDGTLGTDMTLDNDWGHEALTVSI